MMKKVNVFERKSVIFLLFPSELSIFTYKIMIKCLDYILENFLKEYFGPYTFR